MITADIRYRFIFPQQLRYRFLPRPGTLIMDKNAVAFFQHRLKVLKNAVSAAERSDSETARRRVRELTAQMQTIREVLNDAPHF